MDYSEIHLKKLFREKIAPSLVELIILFSNVHHTLEQACMYQKRCCKTLRSIVFCNEEILSITHTYIYIVPFFPDREPGPFSKNIALKSKSNQL